jgi:hypothetical protein
MENKEIRSQSSVQEAAARFLQQCLDKRLPPTALEWLSQKFSQIIQSASSVTLYTAFSAAPRMVEKMPLGLSETELAEARAIRPLWQPMDWTVDQAARCMLLLAYDTRDADQYVAMVEKLFSTADTREFVALYQALPLLPYQERYRRHAAEAVRSNMVNVFHAIALNNPYPFEWFDEPAWNQMVLKVAFIGSPMREVVGLESRANAALAHMLRDLVHERRAARRSFPPQVWALIAPFADQEMVEDLLLALKDEDASQRDAASLAMAALAAEAQVNGHKASMAGGKDATLLDP